MVGIRDIVVGKLSESLQLDADLTLEKAITRVRQSAAVKKQQPILRGAEQPIGHVEAIHKKERRSQKPPKKKIENQSLGCGRCGTLKITSVKTAQLEMQEMSPQGTAGGIHNITEGQSE